MTAVLTIRYRGGIMKKSKQQNPERIGIRDIITIAIFFALILLVYILASPIGFYPKTYIFIWSVCSIFWGTIFLLMYSKVNKKGVPIIFSLIIAILMLSYHYLIFIIILIGGIIAEIIWRKMDRKSIKTMGIVFTIQIIFWQIGATIPIFFMLDTLKKKAGDYADLFDSVAEVTSLGLELVAILATIFGCFVGVIIGEKVLKKHFDKAGII